CGISGFAVKVSTLLFLDQQDTINLADSSFLPVTYRLVLCKADWPLGIASNQFSVIVFLAFH
ncbi:MAG: hypothetical protein MI725_14560, partial [Pirellulales bacterium]|nr:hypothetical protein [Pirellulales bacterium]